jgi:homospermidine synthase
LNEQGNGYLEAKIEFDCFALIEEVEEEEEEEEEEEGHSSDKSALDIYNFGNLLCQLFTEGIGAELCQSLPLPVQYKDLIADCTRKDTSLRFSHVVSVLAPLVPY